MLWMRVFDVGGFLDFNHKVVRVLVALYVKLR
jgi:hypothetical protein